MKWEKAQWKVTPMGASFKICSSFTSVNAAINGSFQNAFFFNNSLCNNLWTVRSKLNTNVWQSCTEGELHHGTIIRGGMTCKKILL